MSFARKGDLHNKNVPFGYNCFGFIERLSYKCLTTVSNSSVVRVSRQPSVTVKSGRCLRPNPQLQELSQGLYRFGPVISGFVTFSLIINIKTNCFALCVHSLERIVRTQTGFGELALIF